MIEVGVVFADDYGDQIVTFAAMPRVGDLVVVTFDGDILPRSWRVTNVLHLIHTCSEPEVKIHVDPA